MKAAGIGAFLVFILSAKSFAMDDGLSPAFIRVYATGTLPRSQSKHSSDMVQFALGNTPNQATTDTSAIITLAPGEAYKGLLFLGRDDTTGLAKFETLGQKKYKFNPSINAFEIQDVENLGNSVAKPLAGAYDPESNIDPILNEVMREFHLVREASGRLKLNIHPVSSCETSSAIELAQTLSIPSHWLQKVDASSKTTLTTSNSGAEETPEKPDTTSLTSIVENSIHLFLKEKYPFLQTENLEVQRNAFMISSDKHANLVDHFVNIEIPCTPEHLPEKAPEQGLCLGKGCLSKKIEEESRNSFNQIDKKTKSAYSCGNATTDIEGYACHSGHDVLHGKREDHSGLCHNGICYDCRPEKLANPNTCKLSYFNPDDDIDNRKPILDCSAPPNKPDSTPCDGGLCFDGSCKAFSELTSAQQPNGTKCKQTKQYPQLRYYFEGGCRECDESSPSKLIGIDNCTAHPGLSKKWLPSRKSCAEPDICVYTPPPPTPPIQSGDQDEKAPH